MTAQEVHADALTWVKAGICDFPDPNLYYGVSWDSLILVEAFLTRHTAEQEGHWALCVCCSSERIINVGWPCPDARAALNYIEGIR